MFWGGKKKKKKKKKRHTHPRDSGCLRKKEKEKELEYRDIPVWFYVPESQFTIFLLFLLYIKERGEKKKFFFFLRNKGERQWMECLSELAYFYLSVSPQKRRGEGGKKNKNKKGMYVRFCKNYNCVVS